nr:immunoglobulin light chain junction region [Macaca mulatta]MPO03155.1 immunoglobulin light chain junction region [Macaca mulatta]MPO03173.1 immunoglobulin light chain junction region [Macaca mulatta]MPO03276.1 immunoglobulin light chain junction region [Macaca mulatta]MPO03656.1 immunoglobulin light chain junction region [Macaca mulatta]
CCSYRSGTTYIF